MNVFEILGDDHDKVKGLLEKLEETTERAVKTRESLFARVNDDLTVHARIEESLFYPVLEDKEQTQAITLKAYETHGVIKRLLSELSAISVESPEWTAKLKVLKDTVEQHVEDEEGEMFKGARQALTKKEIDTLTDQVQDARRKPEEVLAAESQTRRPSVRAGAAANEPARSVAAATGSFCSSCQGIAANFFRTLCGSPQYRRS